MRQILLLLLVSVMMTPGKLTCSTDSMAVYKLVLNTYWSEEKFPKQYPQWRPPAQWSKTIGITHTNNTSLFGIGDFVSDGIKMFVESGDSNLLERETAEKDFLDPFFAPSILQGKGKTEALIFADGINSKVDIAFNVIFKTV